MKILAPIVIALLGLGAGVGAGVALKPGPPEAPATAACGEAAAGAKGAEGSHAAEGDHGAEAAQDCETTAADPFAPVAASKAAHGGDHGGDHGAEAAIVALEKPFVVPVFGGEKVVAMVVVSVAVEVAAKSETAVEAVQPRLRDSFLAVMFRHANSGGFDGTFTEGRKMDDLRSALLVAAREVLSGDVVSEVLITEIARQEV